MDTSDFLTGAAVGYLVRTPPSARRYDFKIPEGFWSWFLITFLGLPGSILLILMNAPEDPDSPWGSPPEWVSALVMVLGGITIITFLWGALALWFDVVRQKRAIDALYDQAAFQQAEDAHTAAVQADINKVRYDHAVVQATGQAVADALRDQRPPEGPTGPSQRPPAPTPPAPPSPMGSTSPTLWVPTFQGPKRRELQRRETSLEGIWMNDYRGVDPDDL